MKNLMNFVSNSGIELDEVVRRNGTHESGFYFISMYFRLERKEEEKKRAQMLVQAD